MLTRPRSCPRSLSHAWLHSDLRSRSPVPPAPFPLRPRRKGRALHARAPAGDVTPSAARGVGGAAAGEGARSDLGAAMGAAAAEANRTLFVGNLDPKVTEELIFELFHQVSPGARAVCTGGGRGGGAAAAMAGGATAAAAGQGSAGRTCSAAVAPSRCLLNAFAPDARRVP